MCFETKIRGKYENILNIVGEIVYLRQAKETITTVAKPWPKKAELCSVHLGIEVSSSSHLSDLVCKPCERKIRNASELIAIIKRDINALPVYVWNK